MFPNRWFMSYLHVYVPYNYRSFKSCMFLTISKYFWHKVVRVIKKIWKMYSWGITMWLKLLKRKWTISDRLVLVLLIILDLRDNLSSMLFFLKIYFFERQTYREKRWPICWFMSQKATIAGDRKIQNLVGVLVRGF